MKNIRVMVFCCAILFALSTVCGAEGIPYQRVNLGMGIMADSAVSNSLSPMGKSDVESREGLAVGVALGYDFGGVRIEGEVAYQKNSLDKVAGTGVALAGDIDSLAVLVNGYWDLENSSLWTPFLGVGIGVAVVNPNGANSTYLPDDYDFVFAYQVSAGLGYAINEHVTFDLTYRYFATAEPKFFRGIEAEYASQNLYAGLRYTF